ncbi:hypothetical protein H0H81_011118 [Sphagnurus paluster]|uniref:tRNA-guanine(15) transglycosylase-like domain-containing protein n=1 Tax=Sphagnurus paluster TaxID=117069 RepID=A0A9P7KL05_9AGAR|nr:hypothetical protein H0H81_011118 [Sphagnurus paluster]
MPSGLQFTLAHSDHAAQFGPRLGTLILRRPNGCEITLDTPTLLTSTSRGVVSHLSRDHVRQSSAIRWVHVPFETFLEQSPPVPTLQTGPHPLHRFLGFVPQDHILSTSVRDPDDVRQMPPNGPNYLAANSLRGVRKITPNEWRTYTDKIQPDFVIALTDTPHTPPPFSQKRLTKSIERSSAWLASLLSPVVSAVTPTASTDLTATDLSQAPTNASDIAATKPAVLVHLAGAASHPARSAFAAALLEPLSDIERASIGGLPTLDAGVAGYTIDLAPLRIAISSSPVSPPASSDINPSTNITSSLSALLQTSLTRLPRTKLRLIYGTLGPHDALHLLRDVGTDVLNASWALHAAHVGVSLDFVFPAPTRDTSPTIEGDSAALQPLGRNLYAPQYALDFAGLSTSGNTCECAACAPHMPDTRIVHGSDASEEADAYVRARRAASASADQANDGGDDDSSANLRNPSYTRAYLHHLLHTHEMSAHALLALHNLAVAEAFLQGVRTVLASSGGVDRFANEVARFEAYYAEESLTVGAPREEGEKGGIMAEARAMWAQVELARGKGRLAREKERAVAGGTEAEP